MSITSKSKFLFITLFLIVLNSLKAQEPVILNGKILASDDVENIHVINKTSKRFTITNEKGEFSVPAKLHDTIQISSLLYNLKELVVYEKMVQDEYVEVTLETSTQQLNEVVVGKILTGNLMDDVSHVEGEPITAKRLGIPSYQGPLMTQSERRLNEATTGGGFLPLNPILNGISGRTKMLKNRIELENKSDLLREIRKNLEDKLFELESLEEEKRTEFFYFCSEDDAFVENCKGQSDLYILEYLKKKLIEFKDQ